MPIKSVKADRQTTSLIDFSFWSNVAVIVLIVVLNIVNYRRAGTEQGAIVNVASPGIVAVISGALCLWMAYSCVGFLLTRRRMSAVFVTLEETGVSGFSLPYPSSAEAGEKFTVRYDEIYSVGIIEVAITKKHVVPALKIATTQKSYVVPAPEQVEELVRIISEKMPNAVLKEQE